MKKTILFLALAIATTVSTGYAQSRFGNALKNAAKNATKEAVNDAKNSANRQVDNSLNNAARSAQNSANNAVQGTITGTNKSTSAPVYNSPSRIPSNALYVSSTTGSNRNDGSKSAPLKNIAKALELAKAGATIVVAEGNYYGLLN
ncbi:MAG: DUF1565 domain-containing protein, partial [Bacteroidales bacterium]|nr:DUF1565 domain-containing protein [Bacteroidales bacterium]